MQNKRPMKNALIIVAGIMLVVISVTSINAQALTRKKVIRLQQADSLDRAFIRSNHALREIGFRVIQTNRRNTVITLEREVGSWLYQTLIARKRQKVNIEIFSFTGPSFRLSWTYFDRQLDNINTIFNIIDFRIENSEPIPPLMLANSILWGIKIDNNPPEFAME